MFKRRIGPDPHLGGRQTEFLDGCPDIWELDDGDFAVIGQVMPDAVRDNLPASASIGRDETIVRLPRRTLVEAKRDIPSR